MPEKENPNSLNDDCSNVSEDDHVCHYLVDAAARISRAFLAKPDLDSDTLKGLQTAISALQRFPSVTPGVSVECSFSSRVGDQKAEQMRYWGFSIFESEFEASSGGSVYTQEVGGDSYTDFSFYIGKSGGRSCDGNPFHWVRELENASFGLDLEVSATDESQYEASVAEDPSGGPAAVGEGQDIGPDQQLLKVPRATFQESLRRLQKAGKKSPTPVRLEWDDGALVVGWSGSVERIPPAAEPPCKAAKPYGGTPPTANHPWKQRYDAMKVWRPLGPELDGAEVALGLAPALRPRRSAFGLAGLRFRAGPERPEQDQPKGTLLMS